MDLSSFLHLQTALLESIRQHLSADFAGKSPLGDSAHALRRLRKAHGEHRRLLRPPLGSTRPCLARAARSGGPAAAVVAAVAAPGSASRRSPLSRPAL